MKHACWQRVTGPCQTHFQSVVQLQLSHRADIHIEHSKSSQGGSLRTLQISGIHVFNKNFSSLDLFTSYEWDSNKAFCRPVQQRSLTNSKGFEGSVWLEESFKNWRGTQCWSKWSGSCSLKKQVLCLFLIWGGTADSPLQCDIDINNVHRNQLSRKCPLDRPGRGRQCHGKKCRMWRWDDVGTTQRSLHPSGHHGDSNSPAHFRGAASFQ